MTEEEAFDKIAKSIKVVSETMWQLDELECLTPDIYYSMLSSITELTMYLLGLNEPLAREYMAGLVSENKPRQDSRNQRIAEAGISEIEQFLASLPEN